MKKNLQIGINSVRLLESSKNGDKWKVVIIEEGISKNGNYYSSKCLQAAQKLFEKAKVCYYEFKNKDFNHLPEVIEQMRPEGFPRQIAGWLENVKYEEIDIEGKKVNGLTGTLNIREGVDWLKKLLTSTWNKGLKQFLGLSINAEGPTSVQLVNGKPINIAQAIENVLSVDIVSNPAAGGRFARLLASISENERGNLEMFKKLIEMLKVSRPELLEGLNVENLTEEEMGGILKNLIEEVAKEKEATKTAKEAAEAVLADSKQKADDAAKQESETILNAAKEAAVKAQASSTEASAALVNALQKEGTMKQITALVGAKEYDMATALLGSFLKASTVKKKESIQNKDGDDEMSKKLQESQKKIQESIDSLEKKNAMATCALLLKEALKESDLPGPVQEKVTKRFSGRIFEAVELEDEIKLEKETLAKLSESGQINLDVADYSVGSEERDRVQSAMDLAFGYVPEESEKAEFEGITPFGGIREAYVQITGDAEVTGNLPKRKLKESVDSSTFTYMLGNTINRKMLKEYKGMPDLWRNISNVVSVKDFKMQELIRWGGLGVLPEVAAARTTQGTSIDTTSLTYAELGFPADSEQIYGIATKGGLITVTRRAIINDDLRKLSQIPTKLARAAARTLNQFVFDLMMGVSAGVINALTKWPNAAGTANSAALYAAGHNNYSTTAFGYDALKDLIIKMYNQGETGYASALSAGVNSSTVTIPVTAATGQYFKAGDIIEIFGEYMQVGAVATDSLTVARGTNGTTAASHSSSDVVTKITSILGLEDLTLWVPKTLQGTANSYNQSVLHPENAENGINQLKGLVKVMVSSYLRGDQNNWYLAAGKNEIDLIEIGFLNGKQNPEILVQDQPNVGTVFTGDLIKYKIRHEYGGVTPDYKAYAAGIVTGV